MKPYLSLGIAVLCVGSALPQEVGFIDLPNVAKRLSNDGSRIDYLICGTDEAKVARRAARVSLEMIESREIAPKKRLEVTVRVENVGELPITVPVHPTLEDLRSSAVSAHFEYTRLELPLTAGIPSMGLKIGELELYGSESAPDTLLTLAPKEWITVRGPVVVHNWYSSNQEVALSSVVQLWRVLPAGSHPEVAPPPEECLRQVSGATIAAHLFGSQE